MELQTLIAVFIGAVITFTMNYLLEQSKNRIAKNKYLFEIKKNKLEEFYILIDNSIKFSTTTATKMYIILHHGKKSVEDSKDTQNADDFSKLTNMVDMYFNDDEKLKELIKKVTIQFKKGQKINEIIIFGKSNNKDKLNNNLVAEWKLFGDILLDIKKEIPRLFKELL